MKYLFVPIVGSLMLAAPALAVGGNDPSTTKQAATSEPPAKPQKITDRNDPDYVRCRSESVIGSKAQKRRICMTNAEWKAHLREGSKRANEFIEDMRVGLNQPG